MPCGDQTNRRLFDAELERVIAGKVFDFLITEYRQAEIRMRTSRLAAVRVWGHRRCIDIS
jgi:hypothetical protein